jgi:hypothetical protein
VRIVLVTLAVALVAAASAAGARPEISSFEYVVEPDLRKCVTPLCGGYWVALANHARTICHDGAVRPRCYVAITTRSRAIPDGSIVRADLDSREFGGFGMLGVLVVADLRAPAGQKPRGPYFRMRDLGIRCVRAPCFSLGASRLNRTYRVTISTLDLGPARLSEAVRFRAEAALATTGGLFVSGRIAATPDGGRALEVSRVYLRGAT